MLAAALLCVAVIAAADWWSKITDNERVEIVAKPLTTVLVMWVAVAAGGPPTATVLGLVALVFCLAGDIALLDSVDWFVGGLGSFLIGHVVFIAMFVSLGLPHGWWAVPAAVIIVGHLSVAGRRIVAGAARTDAALRIPVIAYQVVIGAMAIVAATTGRWWAVAGAVSFVASDTLLGWRSFVDSDTLDPVVVMITYHVAITSLALSLMP